MFKVSSILVCPRYLATKVILAQLYINKEAQLCLKLYVLIYLTLTIETHILSNFGIWGCYHVYLNYWIHSFFCLGFKKPIDI